jgi:hypothetical protein
MSTKERRDRLFKGGRPIIRELLVIDGDSFHKDVGLLWVSYSKGNFFHDVERGLSKEDFVEVLKNILNTRDCFIAEDRNSALKGYGPVGVIAIKTDGWKIEPHAVYFPWATARNKIRAAVSFFQMIRYKKIGCCVVYSLMYSKPLFDKVQEYGVLNYVGRIPNGDARGDEYMYTIKGKL